MTNQTGTHPKVRGTCPACENETLFIGEDGRISCSAKDCPKPDAVDALINRPPFHVLKVDDDGQWAIAHKTSCFPNLLDCAIHDKVRMAFRHLTPAPGRYHVSDTMQMTPISEDGIRIKAVDE